MTKPHAYSHYSRNLHSSAHWTVFAQGWEFSISTRHKIYANQHRTLLCLSTNSSSEKITVRTSISSTPSPPVIHLQVFPFSLGESARRKKVFFGRQIGFFFSCEARVFAYRVQILDGCSDRFSQRREVYTSVSFAGAWKRIRNSSHARWNCSALTG